MRKVQILLHWTRDYKSKNSSKNILKLDIEYDEWKIFEKINVNTLKIRANNCWISSLFWMIMMSILDQIIPYFYSFSKNNYKKINIELIKKYTKVIKKLNDNFILYHISLNNSLPLKNFILSKFLNWLNAHLWEKIN